MESEKVGLRVEEIVIRKFLYITLYKRVLYSVLNPIIYEGE